LGYIQESGFVFGLGLGLECPVLVNITGVNGNYAKIAGKVMPKLSVQKWKPFSPDVLLARLWKASTPPK